MVKGEVKEFDSPYNLLQKRRSHFRKMVEQTGPTASRILHQMAMEAHLREQGMSQITCGTDKDPQLINTKKDSIFTVTPL